MTEYVQVWKARVAESDVEQLLAVRPDAVAEAKRLCPALLPAELVRAEDGTWLDLLTWGAADGEEQLMARAEELDGLNGMHSFMPDAERVGRGEVVASA